MNLNIAYSPCPNDTFIFEALVHNRISNDFSWQVALEDIKTLNSWAKDGHYDVLKVSFASLPYILEDYELLPYGAALGRGVGPLVISKDPHMRMHDLNGKRIATPGANTTAHFLFDFANNAIVEKEHILFHEIEDGVLMGKYDAGIIIHENRFTYQDKGLHKVIDLGDHWEKITDAPIPLGGIVVRRSLDNAVKVKIQDQLKASIRYAFRHKEAVMPYVRSHAQAMEEAVMEQHIQLYVNEFTQDLGLKGRQAIDIFMNELAKMRDIEISQKFYMLKL